MHDKTHYLKLRAKYRALNNENGVRAMEECLKRFDEKQLKLGDKF